MDQWLLPGVLVAGIGIGLTPWTSKPSPSPAAVTCHCKCGGETSDPGNQGLRELCLVLVLGLVFGALGVSLIYVRIFPNQISAQPGKGGATVPLSLKE